jgi:hypothetical protein
MRFASTLAFAFSPLLAFACTPTTSGPDGGPDKNDAGETVSQGACATGDAEITTLPSCTADPSSVDVPAGCTPNVDGTLHADEWKDSACFVVAGGDTTVNMKFANGDLYMATSGVPSCGCPIRVQFDPDGNSAADGDEYAVGVFDDPFGKDGDRGDLVLQNGAFVTGTAPAGIVTACPGSNPNPIRYEWKIPFAALGISAGKAHSFRMAIVHAAKHWPDGLVVDASDNAGDPANWGTIQSSANWH